MRYSSIERELLKKLSITDVGDDCIEICRQAVKSSYHVSEVNDRQLMTFVSNLYAKLHEDKRIKSRNDHGIVDLLNDIVIFKLDSTDKVFCYIIGQMRSACLPQSA